MKKGASHVDWAISIGLFLVFIMLTLMFLRPGTESIYSGDTLLKLVEDGLKDNASFSLKKGFLLMDPKDIESDTYKIRIVNPTKHGLPLEWKANEKHLGLVNSSLGEVKSSSLDYILYDFENEYCRINPCEYEDVLDIEAYLVGNKKNIFWFLYAEDVDYSKEYYDKVGNVTITSPSDPNEGCFLDGRCLLGGGEFGEESNFTYEFGVIELETGYASFKLEFLDQVIDYPGKEDDDYDMLKKLWNIPEDKNFKIVIQERGEQS